MTLSRGFLWFVCFFKFAFVTSRMLGLFQQQSKCARTSNGHLAPLAPSCALSSRWTTQTGCCWTTNLLHYWISNGANFVCNTALMVNWGVVLLSKMPSTLQNATFLFPRMKNATSWLNTRPRSWKSWTRRTARRSKSGEKSWGPERRYQPRVATAECVALMEIALFNLGSLLPPAGVRRGVHTQTPGARGLLQNERRIRMP